MQFIWAKSEDHLKRLLAQGWRCADQRIVHHHFFSVLMVREWHEMG